MRGLYRRGEKWIFDKEVRIDDVVHHVTGSFQGTREEAEVELSKRILAQQPRRHTFAEAVAQYEQDMYRLRSLPRTQVSFRKLLPVFGHLYLEQLHQATVEPWIRSQLAAGNKSATVLRDIAGALMPVLRRANRVWRDGDKPWLQAVPALEVPRLGDARAPRPLTWAEQDKLFSLLPEYLRQPARFLVWTGLRMREALGLRWEWEIEVPELGTSVFLIPGGRIKNKEDRLVVLGTEALKVVEEQWGKSPTWVFPGVRRHDKMPRLDTPHWRAAVEQCGGNIRVHDLKHTFGHRLRAAGVPLESRKVLLGHTTGDITTHYSAPDVAQLCRYINSISREQKTVFRLESRKTGSQNFRANREMRAV